MTTTGFLVYSVIWLRGSERCARAPITQPPGCYTAPARSDVAAELTARIAISAAGLGGGTAPRRPSARLGAAAIGRYMYPPTS